MSTSLMIFICASQMRFRGSTTTANPPFVLHPAEVVLPCLAFPFSLHTAAAIRPLEGIRDGKMTEKSHDESDLLDTDPNELLPTCLHDFEDNPQRSQCPERGCIFASDMSDHTTLQSGIVGEVVSHSGASMVNKQRQSKLPDRGGVGCGESSNRGRTLDSNVIHQQDLWFCAASLAKFTSL
jgi:hypothetical protein